MVAPFGCKCLEGCQKGLPAYLHTLPGEGFPSDSVLRRLTKGTAAPFKGGLGAGVGPENDCY